MAYDSRGRQFLLFGGNITVNGGIQSVAETWLWNGTTWSSYSGHSPSARAFPVMDYDSARGRVVLYGGQYDAAGASPISLFDTWTWDGSKWVVDSLSPAPKLRQPAGTFDVEQGEFTVFGIGASGPETWLWNGSLWTLASPAHSPALRVGEGIAYAATAQQVVLFGGYGTGLGYLNDTWLWDGMDWRSPGLSALPPARLTPSFVSGRQATLFGGGNGAGPLSDSWRWDGSQWQQFNAAHEPPAREAAAGASDGRYVVIVGGDAGGLLPDAWRWDGVDWKQC